ncbi:MAG: hypothetical protein EOP66_01265 [Sphingomonas sp.]|nr:MAG: hypothetical protein EOP66_01265 [Sphingomonas sp.]
MRSPNWTTVQSAGTDGPGLTTEPNAVLAPIHPKAMPVILHDDYYGRWFTTLWDEVKEAVAPYPSQLMRID